MALKSWRKWQVYSNKCLKKKFKAHNAELAFSVTPCQIKLNFYQIHNFILDNIRIQNDDKLN